MSEPHSTPRLAILPVARPFGDGRKVAFFKPPPSPHVNNFQNIYVERSWKKVNGAILDLRWRNNDAVMTFARIIRKLGMMRNFARSGRTAYLTPILGLSEQCAFPKCYFNETISWSFDCWPGRWGEWESYFRRHKVNVAFISARRSAEEMQKRVPEMDVVWLPEATDQNEYRPDKPLRERKYQVVEMGRKYQPYHDKIVDGLQTTGVRHLFGATSTTLIFHNRAETVQGLSETQISICFPSSITSSYYAGEVETATHRYFEGLASNNILLGHTPKELVDLMGFDPGIEADLNDPLGQIQSILANIDEYQPMVDRNYARFLEVGTWDSRVRSICQELRRRGYGVAEV